MLDSKRFIINAVQCFSFVELLLYERSSRLLQMLQHSHYIFCHKPHACKRKGIDRLAKISLSCGLVKKIVSHVSRKTVLTNSQTSRRLLWTHGWKRMCSRRLCYGGAYPACGVSQHLPAGTVWVCGPRSSPPYPQGSGRWLKPNTGPLTQLWGGDCEDKTWIRLSNRLKHNQQSLCNPSPQRIYLKYLLWKNHHVMLSFSFNLDARYNYKMWKKKRITFFQKNSHLTPAN